MTKWQNSTRVVPMDDGKWRSIAGYAGESLVVGRALAAGFNLFVKAWRDAKYDAVLDHNGVLLRIEIKQTEKEPIKFSTTSGGRSGRQIVRGQSREQVLSSIDCDFLFAAHLRSGDVWTVPIEVVEIFDAKSLNVARLRPFRENWTLVAWRSSTGFEVPGVGLVPVPLRTASTAKLRQLCKALGIADAASLDYRDGRARFKASDLESALALKIYAAIASLGSQAPATAQTP